jgi:hypothetical protein
MIGMPPSKNDRTLSPRPKTQWFSPICDIVLAKVELWRQHYERGEVSATCPYHDPVKGIVDAPTRYAHQIPWTPQEMDYLVRMVEDYCPNQALAEEVKCLKDILLKGKMMSGGVRLITLNFYPEHLDQMLESIREAKVGRTRTIDDFKSEDGTLF